MVYYGLLFLVLTDYLRPETYIPFLRSTIYLPIALFLVSFISDGSVSNHELQERKNTRWLLFYLLLTVLSLLFSDVTIYSFRYFKAVLGYVILYFLIAKEVHSLRKVRLFFITILVSHIMLIVLNPELIMEPASRSYLSQASFLGDGNDFAWSLCIVIPFSFYLFQTAEKIPAKTVYAAFTLIIVLAVVGTASRGASLGMVAMFAYLLIKSERKLVGLTVLAVLVGMVMLYAPQSYFERMESVARYEEEGSAQGRLMAWKASIRMVKEHPVLGVGTDHFAMKFGTRYRPRGYEGPWLNAHSIYFKTLGELGLPGIVFLLSIIISSLLEGERMWQRTRFDKPELAKLHVSINAAIVGFSVAGAFLSGMKYPHLYVLAGLVVSSQHIFDDAVALGEESET